METKLCKGCEKEKPLSDFNKKRNGLQPRCKICQNLYSRKHYLDNKDSYKKRSNAFNIKVRDETRVLLFKYKSEHPCVDCGEDDPVVLQFDHFKDKKYNVSEMIAASLKWDTILKEIQKCEVVCANCHLRRTAKQQNWYKTILPQT